MKVRHCGAAAVAVLLTLAGAPAAYAQKDAIEITVDVIERLLRAYTAEDSEREKVAAEREDVEARLRQFRECASTFQAAGGAVGGRLGGLGAKAAMKAKCGATSEEAFLKEKEKLEKRPEAAALAAGGFKGGQYLSVKDRILGFLAGGSGYSYSAAERDALNGKKADLNRVMGAEASRMRVAYGPAVADDDRPGRRGRGRRGGVRPNVWTADLTWEHIQDLFSILYLSGANMFEVEYKPGEWTSWEVKESCNPDERTVAERAFIGLDPDTSDYAQWWRVKSIDYFKDESGKEQADTTVLEVLFKYDKDQRQQLAETEAQLAAAKTRQEREALEWLRRLQRGWADLVRARGRMPGEKEANELMVPAYWGMFWNFAALGALFGGQPTAESIKGATVGTPNLTTPAGTFATRQIRFRAQDGGTLEYWLSEQVPGGQAKFQHTEPPAEEEQEAQEGKQVCTVNVTSMELVGKGTGAKSELGVM
ncbi:MAG: hypothetical protein HY561_05130 [Gemmatimonadetes bacterium]|nr:hypothetical protein [Gemmatimonadota bacterium]